MNLGFRLYDPIIGRFLSVDPLFEMQIGINPYHYCGNDPVNYSDPSGLSCYFDSEGHCHHICDVTIHVYGTLYSKKNDESDNNYDDAVHVSKDYSRGGTTPNERKFLPDATYVNQNGGGGGSDGIISGMQEIGQLTLALSYMVVSNLPIGNQCANSANSFMNGDYGDAAGWFASALMEAGLIGYSASSAIATGVATTTTATSGEISYGMDYVLSNVTEIESLNHRVYNGYININPDEALGALARYYNVNITNGSFVYDGVYFGTHFSSKTGEYTLDISINFVNKAICKRYKLRYRP